MKKKPIAFKHVIAIIGHLVLATLITQQLFFYAFPWTTLPRDQLVFTVLILIPYGLMWIPFSKAKGEYKGTLLTGLVSYLLMAVFIDLFDEIPFVRTWADANYGTFEIDFWDFAIIAAVLHFLWSLIMFSWMDRKFKKYTISMAKKGLHYLAILSIPAVLITLLIIFVPKNTLHTVNLYEADSEKPFANAEIEVTYTKFCPSSPCGSKYSPRNIFSGTSDESGSIRIRGHSTKDINYPGQGDRIIEYKFTINGESFGNMDKEKSDETTIYLISSE